MEAEIEQHSTPRHQISPYQVPIFALPVEILDEVLRCVALVSRSTLPALTLVCRTFMEPSQRLLFASVDLGSKRARKGSGPHPKTDPNLDSRLEGLGGDRRCSNFVKHFSVGRWWEPEENHPREFHPATQQEAVARSILQMRNLDKLELVSFPLCTFLICSISRASRRRELSLSLVDCAFIDCFPSFALPRVYELNLIDTWHRTSQTALVQLVASPALRRASFNDQTFYRFGSGLKDFANLDTLLISCFRPSNAMETVRSLLTPNRSLTELTLRPPINFHDSVGLLASSLPHLRVIKSTAAIVAELSRDRPVHHAAVLNTVTLDSIQGLLEAIKSSTRPITALEVRVQGDLRPHTWNTLVAQVSRSLGLVETLSISFVGPPKHETHTLAEILVEIFRSTIELGALSGSPHLRDLILSFRLSTWSQWGETKVVSHILQDLHHNTFDRFIARQTRDNVYLAEPESSRCCWQKDKNVGWSYVDPPA